MSHLATLKKPLKFLDPDSHANDFQNVIIAFLSKLSFMKIRSVILKLPTDWQKDRNKTEREKNVS